MMIIGRKMMLIIINRPYDWFVNKEAILERIHVLWAEWWER